MVDYIIPIIVVFFNCILGAIAAFFLKQGNGGFLSLKTLIGIGIYGFSAIIFVIALKFAPVSILFPITSATYVWSMFFGKIYLGEHITKRKAIGVLLIMAGITVLALS